MNSPNPSGQLLGSVIDHSLKYLQSISEDQSLTPRSEGKWSPRQILGHLIDSAINNHIRFVVAQKDTERLQIGTYDQTLWVETHDYHNIEWKKICDDWESQNRQLVRLINCIPDSILHAPRADHNLKVINGQALSGAATLDLLIQDYIYHIEHHMLQISQTYQPRFYQLA